MGNKLFISHATEDDDFVRQLRERLELHGQDGWIDSRELRGGDPVESEIKEAIEKAHAFMFVVSPNAHQSRWVGKELRYALDIQRDRGVKEYPVIPLLLDDTRLGVLEGYFDEEPIHISISGKPGGIDSRIRDILVSLRQRLPVDVPPAPQPKAEPLEDLVLRLTDLKFHEEDGVRRASARAKLVYEPAATGQPNVESVKTWRFVAPLGPIDLNEIRWYLEQYAIWPSEHFKPRARKVEDSLVEWGRLLYEAALPVVHTANVMNAWARIDGSARRRFSIYVDTTVEEGAPKEEVAITRETATLLLGLPWELLHDGDAFLFQGGRPTRVRRRLPNTQGFDVPVVATPIRILLVTARPEDEGCRYIDHRASALPLVEAMETLGGLVKLRVLNPPTLSALSDELKRASDAKEPYHVVHFDGHGVYDRYAGLGALCFERPDDTDTLTLTDRAHVNVYTNELGPILKDYRIPLVFLEACQTALAEKASESVASDLLNRGVVSVVAMSHSVLVETARRFVSEFYKELAKGARVGDAMLAGQRELKDDSFRGNVFGAGELRLDDWFVPVLFQEKDDTQLFFETPAPQTKQDVQAALKARLGALPPEPETGFVGRSRELLALQRLLHKKRYAVVRGQGGEGKTALAAEFARWMVRSQQIRRAAFVSVETHTTLPAVLDAIGRQLITDYSVVKYESLDKAMQPVERALVEQSTLLVIDNMESILLPPYMDTPDALSEDVRQELEFILQLCSRLNDKGKTRLVFTSREPLPEPFDDELYRRELHRLAKDDAVKLVERVLNREANAGQAADAAREEIERLVEAVHCHARTLALLAPSLRESGVAKTRDSLVELMSDMDKQYPPDHPESREKSVYASVELSLRRMSPESRKRARVLGVFHGSLDLDVLRAMMRWEKEDVASLAIELLKTGLATADPYNHLTLNPALCPYLRRQLGDAEREELEGRWLAAMFGYAEFLESQQSRKIEISATLTALELPSLLVLLDKVRSKGSAEDTIALTTMLYSLLQNTGRQRLLDLVADVRDAAEEQLGDSWNRARFHAQATRIEQLLGRGQLRDAYQAAKHLLASARAAGESVYEGADYDLALSYALLGSALKAMGRSEQALAELGEAKARFEAIDKRDPSREAKGMVPICLAERGDCLRNLGRLDDAVTAYEESIRLAESCGNDRQVAAVKAQIGTVHRMRNSHEEALKAYEEARDRFAKLNEPRSVSVSWHQTGNVYLSAGQYELAENAYRKSLAIKVQIADVLGQAGTLGQLGILYAAQDGRQEEAAAFLQQAVDRSIEIGDRAMEGRHRNNLANALKRLRRLGQAREEAMRALECKKRFGHVAEPWTTWGILADIETEDGDLVAAAKATQQGIECYLAFRRDGGENHASSGRIAFTTLELLRERGQETALELLQQLAARPAAAATKTFVQALQQIVAGSRDPKLADAPDFSITMAAEILYLIETLEKEETQGE